MFIKKGSFQLSSDERDPFDVSEALIFHLLGLRHYILVTSVIFILVMSATKCLQLSVLSSTW